jgi:hypothetical protein
MGCRALACLTLCGALTGCGSAGKAAKKVPYSLWVDASAQVALERGTREEPYTTLEKALEEAGAGTQLYLAPGVYVANVSIERSLMIACEGEEVAEIVAVDSAKPVVDLAPEGRAKLINLRLTGGSEGIVVGRKAQLTMKGCELANNAGSGLRIESGRTLFGARIPAVLDECSLSGNGGAGLRVEASAVQMFRTKINGNGGAGIVGRDDYLIKMVMSRAEGNGGEGMVLEPGRRSDAIFLKSAMRGNGRDGVRIMYGKAGWFFWQTPGTVKLEENALEDNGGYGVACLDRESGKWLEGEAAEEAQETIRLENNRYAGNGLGMAAGIEPK